jgi:HK97 gp10 family phage protein
MRAIIRGTEQVRNTAISLILNTPKTGRVYVRGGVEHQASAPGEAPASDTGDLTNKITTNYDFTELSGTVTSNSVHGLMLEYGTKNMEPRPYLRPALAMTLPDLKRYLEEEMAKEFK